MSSQNTETKRLVCLLMGLFTATVWAAPLVLFRFVIFKDQYLTAFVGVLCWCATINGISLLLNIIDKVLACCHAQESRVPEPVLHVFTLLGGAPGSMLGMFLCFHKFSKGSYQLWFIVASSLSVTFIFGAFGVAYGLEWYQMNQAAATILHPYNVTTEMIEFTTVDSTGL